MNNRRCRITLCKHSYFYNLRQHYSYIIYDFDEQQCPVFSKGIAIKPNRIQTAEQFNDAIVEVDNHESHQLLECKKRIFNFVLPFRSNSAATDALMNWISPLQGFEEIAIEITLDKFNNYVQHYQSDKTRLDDRLYDLESFINLLITEKVHEIIVICEPKEKLIQTYPFLFNALEYNFPNEILTNKLYLGDYHHAKNIDVLKHLNITHIINATTEVENYAEETITYFNIRVLDEDNVKICDYFHQAYDFIVQHINNNCRVLVHCAQGKSRSACIVIMFLMKYYNWTYNQAYSYVKKRRDIVCVNSGFEEQLKLFEQRCVE